MQSRDYQNGTYQFKPRAVPINTPFTVEVEGNFTELWLGTHKSISYENLTNKTKVFFPSISQVGGIELKSKAFTLG